jgi:hypothetical protein
MAEITYWTVIGITMVCFMIEYTKGDDDDFR